MGMGDNDFFEKLEKNLPMEVATKSGFVPLGHFGERHGSWEIAFCKKGGLNRFVSLSFTMSPEALPGKTYIVELWAGADDGSHLARRLVAETKANEDDLTPDSLDKLLRNRLEHAISVAEELTDADLDFSQSRVPFPRTESR